MAVMAAFKYIQCVLTWFAWQVATLVFYIVTAVQFRPQAEGAYMVITEPDDDDFRKATSA